MPTVLVCLIGLPGAGKSQLCSELANMLADCSVLHVEYDRLVQVKTDSSWKSTRIELLNYLRQFFQLKTIDFGMSPLGTKLHQLISSANLDCNGNLVVLLDDNMYLRSMRYSAYQLARDCGIGFCQIYCKVDIEVCRVRNSSRVPDQQVTEAVISRMSQLIEPPDSSMWKWELNNLTYSNKPMKDDLIQLIRNGLHHPVKPLEIADSQMAEESRRICKENLIYRADQLSRKLISSRMVGCTEDRSSLAKTLAEKKVHLLAKLREMKFLNEEIVEDMLVEVFD